MAMSVPQALCLFYPLCVMPFGGVDTACCQLSRTLMSAEKHHRLHTHACPVFRSSNAYTGARGLHCCTVSSSTIIQLLSCVLNMWTLHVSNVHFPPGYAYAEAIIYHIPHCTAVLAPKLWNDVLLSDTTV